jgi:protein involved in polysaccharide export with SLBB domain
MEMSLAAAPLSATHRKRGSAGAQIEAAKQLVEQMKRNRPDGRIVLNVSPQSTTIPTDISLQNNDAIFIPRKENTVGVFGAVAHPGTFLIAPTRDLAANAYIERVGGVLRSADRGQTIIIRANGDVVSKHAGALRTKVEAGDLVLCLCARVPRPGGPSSRISRNCCWVRADLA